ncbi:hypothetical protein [Undibacterium sp.]|jgi:hypothetical protein|uniref:hypothetical protein n=1 Tax=Undibacterium sp. TaxID=1914977 RepID=UPI002C2C0745|nr:hypothetical protein [Undibacterium sp.]HTD06244.1 hypothetical protein [Undibacterium sp.]
MSITEQALHHALSADKRVTPETQWVVHFSDGTKQSGMLVIMLGDSFYLKKDERSRIFYGNSAQVTFMYPMTDDAKAMPVS